MPNFIRIYGSEQNGYKNPDIYTSDITDKLHELAKYRIVPASSAFKNALTTAVLGSHGPR